MAVEGGAGTGGVLVKMEAVSSLQSGGRDLQERGQVRRPGWLERVLEGAAWNRRQDWGGGDASPFEQ